ncbi:MAG TPA: AraC family transcriptional regulator [Chloroflexota bacterium]
MIIENDWTILQIFKTSDKAYGEEVSMAVKTLDVSSVHLAEPQKAFATEREARREQGIREELVDRIARAVRDDGTVQPLPGLYLSRSSVPLEPLHGVLEPSLCVIAQGSKEVLLGESRYRYDPSRYLLATVELPRISQVLEASPERPYLSFRLALDPALVGSVMVDAGQDGLSSRTISHAPSNMRAISVNPADADLLDAIVRLVRLLDSPSDARVLLPLITREIIYRLLAGEQGVRLRHLAFSGGYTPDIARAIERLRQDFDQPLRVEQLARELGMSVSSLHHHFRAVTELSPLQFQKRLRLLEARRLMLGEDLDAASAAYRVGYRDASHFNREYKSLFGLPPLRDVQRLRALSQMQPALA